MVNIVYQFYLMITVAFFCSVTILASSSNSSAITRNVFDFVVGVDGDFKAALTAASAAASSQNRFYLFFPNGNYDIGTLTGDVNQKTTVSTSNLSFIGENTDSTVIFNKAINESISTTATLYFNKADNLYLQDLTVLNKGNYGDPSAVAVTGRYVAIQDQGDRNIYKNVKLCSNQDTYYTLSNRTYWEDGEIHGFVDFICGYGDVFFNRCLLYLEQRSTVVIAAPSTKTSWGYVFMNCTIDGPAGDGYRLARPWNNQPKCVFINTTMNKVPGASGWGDPMKAVPSVFAEYNSMTAAGTPIDLSARRTTYTNNGTTVTLNPILTDEQAATYTLENVVGGSDDWEPDKLTRQANAPAVFLEDSMLKWNDDENVLCWVVFKDGRYHTCIIDNWCETAGNDPDAVYTVRAANAMGGLGPVSNTVAGTVSIRAALSEPAGKNVVPFFNPGRRVLHVRVSPASSFIIEAFALNGKRVLLRKYPAGGETGVVKIGCDGLRNGLYLIRYECDDVIRTGRLHIW